MGDSTSDIFGGSFNGLGTDVYSALGAAGQAYAKASKDNDIFSTATKLSRLNSHLDSGVNQLPGDNGASSNKPQQTGNPSGAAATVNPEEVEQQWMSRLSKFAGLAGSTGVKLGGL